MRQMERAGFTDEEPRLPSQPGPDFPGAPRLGKEGSGRLADGPDHAEVADGGALGAGMAFQHDDPQTLFGEGDDAGANDHSIEGRMGERGHARN